MLGAPALALLVSSNPGRGHRGEHRPRCGFAITTVARRCPDRRTDPAGTPRGGTGPGRHRRRCPGPHGPAGRRVDSRPLGVPAVFAATAAAALLVLVVLPGLPDQRGLDGGPGVLSRLEGAGPARPAVIFSRQRWRPGCWSRSCRWPSRGGPPRWLRSRCSPSQRRPRSHAGRPGRPGTGAGTPYCLVPGWSWPRGHGGPGRDVQSGPVIAGATAFGIGIWIAAERHPDLDVRAIPGSGHTAVSAIWNAAYDAAWAPAPWHGAAVGSRCYPGMFLLTAALAARRCCPRRTGAGSNPAADADAPEASSGRRGRRIRGREVPGDLEASELARKPSLTAPHGGAWGRPAGWPVIRAPCARAAAAAGGRRRCPTGCGRAG